MNCPKCGSQNEDNAKFCRRCYTRFVREESQSAPQRSTKSLTLVVVLGFIIVALVFAYLVIGAGPLWRMLDREIVQEYDRRLAEVNAIFQDHDRLTKKAQEAASVKDAPWAASFAKEYSQKTRQWGQVLNDFKLFIETNDKRIRRAGISPDYVRDNIKNTLAAMKENEVRFQKEAEKLADQVEQEKQGKIQLAKDAIEALKKLEARFLVGISYRDFAPVLGETVHQVRVFLESPSVAQRRELAASIQKVIFHYTMVKDVWDAQISDDARNIVVDEGHKNPEWLDSIISLYPEVKNIKRISTTSDLLIRMGVRPSTSYLYAYSDMRKVILKKASEELRKATSLLPK